MPCTIKNPADVDLDSLEPHINGMYDHFEQKYGFKKPPVMVFDTDPDNQHNVLGKTAYYNPESLQIHIYTDGRHPKDMLRSIAHELIHHRQNLEGRLNVGGYHGEGYYLKNKELKKLEQEAMKDGNETLREYEDGLKLKRNEQMSLKEWKNNELNQLLMKKFGIIKESEEQILDDVEEEDNIEETNESVDLLNDEESNEELEEQSKSNIEDRGGRRADGGRRLDEEENDKPKNERVQESINKLIKENKKIRLRLK